MDAMNLGFLAKHLLMTELDGEVEDVAGGCYAWGTDLWAGLWNLAAAGDPEKFIVKAQNEAQTRQTSLGGLVLLTEPAGESAAAVTQLAEALYVYGYPQSAGADCGPEMVQVLAKPIKPPAVAGLAIMPFTGAGELMTRVLAEKEQLFAVAQARRPDWLTGVELYLAQLNGEPVGIAGIKGDGLAARLMLLWVAEAHRRQGFGQALLAHCANQSTAAGKLLTSAWTYRTGKWRYFLNRRGFEEQLCAQYYRLEK